MATQYKSQADVSYGIDNLTLFDQGSFGNPNVNLDHPSSMTSYDQIVYSILYSHGSLENIDKDVNIQPIDGLEQNGEIKPSEEKFNPSATPSNEQIIDSSDSNNPVNNPGHDETHSETISDALENSKNIDSTGESDIINPDQSIINSDSVNTADHEDDSFIISENVSICPHDIRPFENFIIANDTLLLLDAEQNYTFTDIEEFFPDEEFTSDNDRMIPLILGDDSLYIMDSEETEPDITSDTSDNAFDSSAEEPVDEFEIPTELLVDDGNDVPTEPIDDNTDPLAEVTDESFTMYSYFYCGTMDVSFSLEEYIDESYQFGDLVFSLAEDYISIDDLTIDEAPIDTLCEVATEDLTLIPLGLPSSTGMAVCECW